MQIQLRSLGFYKGDLNGYQTRETIGAIRIFKELYDLPVNGLLSGEFLSALLRAERQHIEAQKSASISQVRPSASYRPLNGQPFLGHASQSRNSVAPILPSSNYAPQPRKVEVRSTVSQATSEASSASIRQLAPNTRPAVRADTKLVELYVSPQQGIEPVRPNGVKPKVVVEARRTKANNVVYPLAASKRNYFVDVKIVVAYDINVQGDVMNRRIVSNDHDGRYNSAFIRAALKAVENQKFAPKTINGEAVTSTGRTQRIIFKAG